MKKVTITWVLLGLSFLAWAQETPEAAVPAAPEPASGATVPPTAAVSAVASEELTLDVSLAYFFPSLNGYGYTGFSAPGYAKAVNPEVNPGEAEFLGGSLGAPGLEASLTKKIIMPFLNFPGALTQGNNLTLAGKVAATPITVQTSGEVILTPLALLKLRIGASSGSGWTLAGLKGLGTNTDGVKAPDSLSGHLIQAWSAATLQFDLGAVIPGDYTHVVTVADAKLQWQHYFGGPSDRPWYWQADAGENLSGFLYHGTYFLGYQLPKGLPVSLTGILAEQKFYLGQAANLSPMRSTGGWGTDFVYWTLGAMASIPLGEKSSLLALLQIQDKRKFSPETAFRNDVTERDFVGGVVEFNRFALVWSQKL